MKPHYYSTALLAVLSLLCSLSVASGQITSQVENLQNQVIGSAGAMSGGGLSIEPANGNVSYRYPISSHSVGGYPINVSLNYCGGASMTTFTNYSVRTDPSCDGCDGWNQFFKLHPMWLISVNGFAVQALTKKTAFFNDPTVTMGPLAFREYLWLLDGYDYCNRMNKMLTSYDQDVIKILMADGGTLELRNAYQKIDIDTDSPNLLTEKDYYTGYYYSNGINGKGYGIVEYADTTEWWPEYISEIAEQTWPERYAYLPRILRYYDGSGLEYIFREHPMPYGTIPYKEYPSANGAYATIFYLEKINSSLRTIADFTYSRHNFDDNNERISKGRALLIEFSGHRLTYGNNSMTIEALGRTIELKMQAQWYGDGFTGLEEVGEDCHIADHSNPQEVFEDGGVNNHAGRSFMITSIRDPEAIRDTTTRKATTFSYERFGRDFEGFHFPAYNIDGTLAYYRIGRVTYPTGAYDSLEYYAGDNVLTAAEVSGSNKEIIYDLSHAANWLYKYDRDDNLLARQEIYFYTISPGAYYTRRVDVATEDMATNHFAVERQYYKFHEVNAYKGNFHQSFMNPKVVFPALEKKVMEADDIVDTVITTYANNLPGATGASQFVWVPVKQHRLSSQGSGPVLTTGYSTFEYEFEEINDFGGNTTLASLFGRGLVKRTTRVHDPSNTSATLTIGESHYLNLPLLVDEPVTRKDSIWDEHGSWLATDNARRNGSKVTINQFTTVDHTNEPMNIPPIYGLLEKSYSLDPSTGNVIGGMENTYETTFNGLALPTYPRGALKTNKILGENGKEIQGVTLTYSGGWYRNLPRKSTNNAGAEAAMFLDYAQAPSLSGQYPSGTKVFNTDATSAETLFEVQHIFEVPLATEQYVRYWNPATSSIQTRTLASYNKRTYHGQVDAVIDANGWYAASEYDLNGRAKLVREPFDFPTTYSCSDVERAIRIREHSTALVVRQDTLDCDSLTTKAGMPGAPIAMPHRLIAGHLITIPDSCNSHLVGHEAYPTQLQTATITYTAGSNDALQVATSVNKAALHLHPTSVTIDGCATIKINLREFGYSAWHTFSCPPLGTTTTASTGALPFTVDLMPVLTDLQNMNHNDKLHIDISMETPGALVEFASYADDIAPSIKVKGSFTDCSDNDFTYAFAYDDINLKMTTYAKIDDNKTGPHTTTPAWTQTWGTHAGRYSGSRDNFRSDGALYSSHLLIGHPDTYSRIDSVYYRLTGLGIGLTAINPYGDSVHTVYDAAGRVDSVYNPDGTFVTAEYQMNTQTYFGINVVDQNFYGVCYKTKTSSEGGLKQNIEYRDAFGRVRRTVEDVGGAERTVQYEYDDKGRLIAVIDPNGDQTEYFYDDLHRLKYKKNNDAGTVSYAYDDLGNVRFTQTEGQAKNNKMTFVQYDDLNRPTVIGEAELKDVLEEDIQGGAPSLGRATESVDPNTIHSEPATQTIRTVNSTLWMTPSTSASVFSFWTLGQLSTSACLPAAYAPAQEETTPVGPYLVHPANYYVFPSLSGVPYTKFEHVANYPQHVLTTIHYDVLPPSVGAVWQNFPTTATWNALAPKGQVRNLKGRQSAVAYREHSGEPFHYVVTSYDERGRIEALLRYTENLGFDAVYYTYNSANQVLSIRVVDPLNQHATWYSYDNNGRMNKAWTKLSTPGAGAGFGVSSPMFPSTLISKPSTEDMTFVYDRLGRLVESLYLPESVTTKYGFNINGSLDSMFATASSIADTLFKQVLIRNDRGRITGQRSRHASGSNRIESYGYNGLDQLTSWTDNGTTYNYTFDDLGNRLSDNEGGVSRTYTYGDVARPNRLTQMSASALNKRTNYSYDNEGALVSRISQDYVGGVWQDSKREYFEYTPGGLTRQYRESLVTPVVVPCSTSSYAQHTSERDWRYRYSATGEREQKRLYYSPEGDACGNTHLWTYYLLGAGDEQLVVYNGRQTADNDACGNSGRRVHMYAVEYISYCGAASITTRPNGNKELNLKDHLGSVRSVVKASGVLEKYDYRPFGKLHWSSSGTTKREGFIDKEMDRESNLGDFGVRKYDAEIGRFLSVDVLFEVQPGESPYHYAYNDPINGSDGSGMFTQTAVSGSSGVDRLFDIGDAMRMQIGGYGGTQAQSPFQAFPIGRSIESVIFEAKYLFTVTKEAHSTTQKTEEMQIGGTFAIMSFMVGVTPTIWCVDDRLIGASEEALMHSLASQLTFSHAGISGYNGRRSNSGSGSSSGSQSGGWLLNAFQTTLDVVGLVPVVGEWADGLNAAIYLANGDYVNAALSAAAMIPVAGWGATGTKMAIKTADAITTTKNVVKSTDLIKGYTKHGINQAISRNNGRGVSVQAIADAVKNPIKVVSQNGEKTKYIGKSATVILSKEGKLITTFGKPRNP